MYFSESQPELKKSVKKVTWTLLNLIYELSGFRPEKFVKKVLVEK